MSQGTTTGIISLNGTIDAIPTNGSANAVSSNGVFDALALKQPLDSNLTSWAAITRAANFDTFVATPSSSNLLALVTDETGTGSLVFGTSPTLLDATNNGLFTGVGTTQTGSSAIGALYLSQTWNTSGLPTAIKLNVTDTASDALSLLQDLQVGGASFFNVNKAGLVTTRNINLASTGALRNGGTAGINFNTAGSFNSLTYTSTATGTGGNAHTFTHNFSNHTTGTLNTIAITGTYSQTSGSGSATGLLINNTINQTGTANAITRGIYINPILTSATEYRAIEIVLGKLFYSNTITPSGTTGAQTINKISGKVNAAAGTTSLVVTNSLVTTSSIVICQMGTNDATARITSSVEANGSFTINYVAPTAETVIKFMVIN